MADPTQGELLRHVRTVSEITRQLEEDLAESYRSVIVRGELSNFRRAASGHLYFVLKDASAQLRAVMFRGQTRRLKFMPADGLEVEAVGDITLYAPRGDLQILIQSLKASGQGALMEAFEKLKESLQQEGLFDLDRKQNLPTFPQTIVLITSPSGAAVQDMIHVTRRRWPGIELVLVPVAVQGPDAAPQIAEGIRTVDRWGKADLVILGRGGGSLEDLWAFNEEEVVRAVADCSTPIVSAVGHETDTTLTDYAADVRAATPSAAAELVVPDYRELLRRVDRTQQRLVRYGHWAVATRRTALKAMVQTYGLRRPKEFLHREQLNLDRLYDRLCSIIRTTREKEASRVRSLERTLRSLDPSQVLGRGYAWVRQPDGSSVQSAQELSQEAWIQFASDRARVQVLEKLAQDPFDPLESK